MQMRAGGVAGGAHVGDLLPLGHGLAGRNRQARAVAVDGRIAVAVVDDDMIAIAGTAPDGTEVRI